MSSLGKILKRDATVNLLFSLLAQINSLIFSTYSKANLPIAAHPHVTANAAAFKSANQLKQTLTKYAIAMCKSGSFAHIVTHTIQHLTANKRIQPEYHTDISYFLWLIKFIVPNFVLKRLEPSASPSNPEVSSTTAMTNPRSLIWSSSTSSYYDHSNTAENSIDPVDNKKMKFEKTFFNDTQLPSAVATKQILLSYDLLAFLTFSMISNFERLLFESNAQNMTVLKVFSKHQQRQQQQQEQSNITAAAVVQRKLVNARSLKLFYLSISCVYEIIECINMHLEYLNSSQYQKVKINIFIKEKKSLIFIKALF